MIQRKNVYKDVNELGRLNAAIKLLAKLEEGELSVKENDWITVDEVETALGL